MQYTVSNSHFTQLYRAAKTPEERSDLARTYLWLDRQQVAADAASEVEPVYLGGDVEFVKVVPRCNRYPARKRVQVDPGFFCSH